MSDQTLPDNWANWSPDQKQAWLKKCAQQPVSFSVKSERKVNVPDNAQQPVSFSVKSERKVNVPDNSEQPKKVVKSGPARRRKKAVTKQVDGD